MTSSLSEQANRTVRAWPGDPALELEQIESMDHGAHANVTRISAAVHLGTHVDALLEAEAVVRELTNQRVFDDPIVTEIAPLGAFYRAEQYHQGYYRQNPNQPYCRAVIAPNSLCSMMRLSRSRGQRVSTKSTSRPGRADITAIRSASIVASSSACVIRNTVASV